MLFSEKKIDPALKEADTYIFFTCGGLILNHRKKRIARDANTMKNNMSTVHKHYEDILRSICEVIHTHHRFLICGHVRPDGDCLGSALALAHILKGLDKEVRVYIPQPIPDHFFFLPGIHMIEPSLETCGKPDVTIFVDCSSQNRVDDTWNFEGVIVNIDHHQTNNYFGEFNYIDMDASAVGEQIFYLAQALNARITPDIANNIYLALLADTGGFRFSNTSARTFQIAADLCLLGANPADIAQDFYSNISIETTHIIAHVIGNLHFELDGQIVWGEITQDVYQKNGGETNEPEGLVGELRRIKGVEVAVLLHELPEGGLRAGLRSKEEVDVSKIAAELGGGGHPNAAGLYVKGDYETIKQQLLSALRAHCSDDYMPHNTPLPTDTR